MRTTQKTLLILAVVSVIFVAGQFLFVPKTYVNSAVIQALQAPKIFLDVLGNRHELGEQLKEAQLENQSLRAQLMAALHRPEIITEGRHQYITAPVYSQYPLASAGKIVIGAGAEEGVREGMVVLASPGVFIGEVLRVYAHQSEVRTVYDPGWELPVRIGKDGIDSLLIGGPEPRLTLISKKKPAITSMPVYTAYKKYPYALLAGSMGDPSDSEQNLFQEAPLMLPYLLGETQRVFIERTP